MYFRSNFFKRLLILTAFLALPAGIAQAQQGPMPVTVAKPLILPIVEWDEYTGRFKARDRVEIRARVSGFLDSVHFQEGQTVEKGQLLFVIDPRPFEAELNAVKATLEGAVTRYNLAQREFERGEQLVKQNALSRERFDQRRAERETTRTSVMAARAQVRIAELNLEFTNIRAPITGRISDARIDPGNLVAGGSGQTTLLTTIVSTDPILFTFTASEAEYLKYTRLGFTGQRVSARDKAIPVAVRLMDEVEFLHKGAMSFIDNELSPDSATIRGQAEIANSNGFLTPGVFGRMRVPGSAEYEATLIPDAAVVSDQSRKIVMAVDAEGTVSARVVELGPLYHGLRVIRGGVGADDRIIVKGIQRGRPGGKVVPKEMALQPDGTLKPLSGS